MKRFACITGALCLAVGTAAIVRSQAQPPGPPDRGPAAARGEDDEPRPPRPPRREPEGPAITLTGKVKSFAKNGRGDVDGLVLGDDAVVHFPPHVGREVADVVKVGDEVRVTGHHHTLPEGEKVVLAQSIKQVETGKEVTVDEPPPRPRGPRERAGERPEPPHERMLAEIRAIRQLVAPGTEVDEREPDGPPHEQVLRELRDLRKLIEAKQARRDD